MGSDKPDQVWVIPHLGVGNLDFQAQAGLGGGDGGSTATDKGTHTYVTSNSLIFLRCVASSFFRGKFKCFFLKKSPNVHLPFDYVDMVFSARKHDIFPVVRNIGNLFYSIPLNGTCLLFSPPNVNGPFGGV